MSKAGAWYSPVVEPCHKPGGGLVEFMPVMVDVGFPVGDFMVEKGLMCFCELSRLPRVDPTSVEPHVFLGRSVGLEECLDVCVCRKMVSLLGSNVEVIQDGVSNMGVFPDRRGAMKSILPRLWMPLVSTPTCVCLSPFVNVR